MDFYEPMVSSIGLPPRPLPDVDLSSINLASLDPFPEAGLLEQFPSCEDVGVTPSKYWNFIKTILSLLHPPT